MIVQFSFSSFLLELEDKLLQMEEIFCFQNGSCGLDIVDWKTTFFHTATLVRRNRKKRDALKIRGGLWVHDQDRIKEHVLQFYKQLLTEDGVRTSYRAYVHPAFSDAVAISLRSPILEDEVRLAVRSMKP